MSIQHQRTLGQRNLTRLATVIAVTLSIALTTIPSIGNAQENDQAEDQPAASETEATAGEPQSSDTKSADESQSQAIEWSPKMTALRDKIHKTLDVYYRRPVNSASRTPWALIHWTVAFGADTQVRRGGPTGEPITAVGWLCFNGNSAGQSILRVDGSGRLAVQNGPGVQGHDGQLLAVLAQSRINTEYPMRVGGKKFTIADLVEYEKRTCRAGSELTFKLIGLSHYLPPNATWKNDSGETWNVQRLIREELAQSVRGAACGGSHRMMGFGYAVRTRRAQGEPMVGEFRRAEIFVNDYFDYTFKLQNADGSLSTSWFQGRGSSSDAARRVQTTGHMLEWLVYSLPHDRLQDERVVRAVDHLSGLLQQSPNRNWKIGPLGHALHALVIYEHRVFKTWNPRGETTPAASTAGTPQVLTTKRLAPEESPNASPTRSERPVEAAAIQGPSLFAPKL